MSQQVPQNCFMGCFQKESVFYHHIHRYYPYYSLYPVIVFIYLSLTIMVIVECFFTHRRFCVGVMFAQSGGRYVMLPSPYARSIYHKPYYIMGLKNCGGFPLRPLEM